MLTRYNSLYDLAAYPECIKDLRDEVNSVLAENGGIMNSQALFQMKLLDSFLLESQRHNPVQMSKFRHSFPAPLLELTNNDIRSLKQLASNDSYSSPSRSKMGHKSQQA